MAEITAKLATYQKEFAAWAETARQTAAYDDGMMKTFRGFEPLMIEIAQGVERRYKEAEAAEASTRDAVRNWMLIAFAGSVLLGVAAGVAMIGPARRGSNSDPLDALRCE